MKKIGKRQRSLHHSNRRLNFPLPFLSCLVPITTGLTGGMPFGLKNAGATYQRAMITLFHDMVHFEIEVYIDDMIFKSRKKEDYLVNFAIPTQERQA